MNEKTKNVFKNLTIALVVIVAVYCIGLVLWVEMITPPTETAEKWYHAVLDAIYVNINPFTYGAYMIGLTTLLSYIFVESKIIKIVLSAIYLIVTVCSLVVIMGMTHLWELLIYLPHVFIITLCLIVLVVKFRCSEFAKRL